ncbi:hypothetical protein VMCG_08269 [Cytospora schulzeri]|uniref:Uncharacterized protein n=1 Tax=Cytospora schulzeri TaxID=448051 RepID=A0A423VT11_9PEZI|nr:hypothetical protein VMCG_08269 [Valsa malicola]
MKTTSFFAFIGAATALVARTPGVAGGLGGANTLIEYQRWCPVCDTVERNQACISKRASCQGSTLIVPDSAPECADNCSSNCQLSYVANSDYGYSCNATMPTVAI